MPVISPAPACAPAGNTPRSHALGQAPILPLTGGEAVSDPLTQAMTLTALIIGFATTALLLAMAYRVYTTHRSVDLDALSRSERSAEEELERGPAVEREETRAS